MTASPRSAPQRLVKRHPVGQFGQPDLHHRLLGGPPRALRIQALEHAGSTLGGLELGQPRGFTGRVALLALGGQLVAPGRQSGQGIGGVAERRLDRAFVLGLSDLLRSLGHLHIGLTAA